MMLEGQRLFVIREVQPEHVLVAFEGHQRWTVGIGLRLKVFVPKLLYGINACWEPVDAHQRSHLQNLLP